ncbi:E3 SUMO- ligase 2-like protein [Labeo rohita]|uniref:Nuclear pore complex protein Nup153 n=1 Tax=Labeo rohita TaxID=84645 RepID=A0A498LRB9_LABRO|nr:E3 SUMO- ligase 2-like protein [Labeo rohita]
MAKSDHLEASKTAWKHKPCPQPRYKRDQQSGSDKEGEWDCDLCCVRNAPTSAVCVACSSPAPTATKVKPVEELKISAPVAGDSSKNTASTNFSSKGFTFGSQNPVSFRFRLKDAAVTSAGFGAQAEKKTTEAPQHEKMSTAPAVPFGIAPCSTEKNNATLLRELFFAKKDGQWDCDTCLIRNEATSNHCVSCKTANPNMKNKTSAKPSSSSFTFGFGSSVCQPTVKTDFIPGTSFQFSTRNDKAPLEGFKFESSKTEAEKSSSSSEFSFKVPVPTFKFDIAKSEAKASDKQSQNGSASDLLKKVAELHEKEEKEAAKSSSDQSVDACGHDNKPLNTDNNFTWSNIGTPVFGSAAAQNKGEETPSLSEEESSDDEEPDDDELHFE